MEALTGFIVRAALNATSLVSLAKGCLENVNNQEKVDKGTLLSLGTLLVGEAPDGDINSQEREQKKAITLARVFKPSDYALEDVPVTNVAQTHQMFELAFFAAKVFLGYGWNNLAEVTPFAESVHEPGTTCLMSTPLDQYVTKDILIEELKMWLQAPLFPREEWVLKEIQIEDLGADGFTIKVIHDPRKWDSWTFQSLGIKAPDLSNTIRLISNVSYLRKEPAADQEHGEVFGFFIQDYKGDGTLLFENKWILHQDPLRLEVIQFNDEVRFDGKYAAMWIQNMVLNPILHSVNSRDVIVHPNMPSLMDPSVMSCVSDSLEGFATYDELLENMFKLAQTFRADCKVNVISDSEMYLIPERVPSLFENLLSSVASGFATAASKATVASLPAQEQDTINKLIQNANADDITKLSETWHIRFDYEKGSVVTVVTVMNELLYTAFIQVHKDPLRVESWTSDGLTRRHGYGECKHLEGVINKLIKQDFVSGWWW